MKAKKEKIIPNEAFFSPPSERTYNFKRLAKTTRHSNQNFQSLHRHHEELALGRKIEV
jgi:hypothetical protein